MVPTIAICGSMSFVDEMETLATVLCDKAHILLPEREESRRDWRFESLERLLSLKRYYIDVHLEKIRASDAILIANYEKHGIAGYIGPNTLIEAAFAHALGKRVLLLYMPNEQPCRIEALSIASSILEGDVERAIVGLSN
jgi:hypothetical protein